MQYINLYLFNKILN